MAVNLTFAAMLSFDCVKLTNWDIDVRCPGVYEGAISGCRGNCLLRIVRSVDRARKPNKNWQTG